MNLEIRIDIYILPCVKQIASGNHSIAQYRELSSLLCDDLDGQDGGQVKGGWSKREGMYVYI